VTGKFKGKKSYLVVEQFSSFQGEGCHAGRAAFFIRTFGCPVQCPWCDSANTWHPDYRPAHVDRCTVEELTDRAVAAQPDFVVITGGEPTIHDLTPLTDSLRGAGLAVHLETSGAFPWRGEFDWVTVSPKIYREPLRENVQRANELKLIVETPDSVSHWENALGTELIRPERSVWLHPEWSLRDDKATLERIAKIVRERGAPFRAGWQLHKLYRVP